MKKFLVVLLIAVLAAGFVFADIAVKGNVKAGFTFDFDKKNGGFGVFDDGAKRGANWSFAKATVTFDTGKGGVNGTKDVYAEVEVSATLEGTIGKREKNFNYKFTVGTINFDIYKDISNATPSLDEIVNGLGVKATIKLEKAQIVTKNFTLDLLYQYVGANYALNPIQKAEYNNGLSNHKNDIPGMTLHISGYDIGVGFWTQKNEVTDAINTETIFGVQSPEYKLSDELTARVDVGSYLENKKTDENNLFGYLIGGSLKTAYTTDNIKATIASDLGYEKNKEEDDGTFNFDIGLSASIYPVDLDVFYASAAIVKGTETTTTYVNNEPLIKEEDDDADAGTVEKLLSVRAIFDLEKIADTIPAKVTITANNLLDSEVTKNPGKDAPKVGDIKNGDEIKYSDWVLDSGRSLDIDLNTKAIPDTSLTVYAHNILTNKVATIGAEVENKSVENVTINAKGEYTIGNKDEGVKAEGYATLGFKVANIADTFDAYLKGGVHFKSEEDVQWGIACGASTDKIIENAILKAEFNWNPAYKKLTGAENKSMFVGVDIAF